MGRRPSYHGLSYYVASVPAVVRRHFPSIAQQYIAKMRAGTHLMLVCALASTGRSFQLSGLTPHHLARRTRANNRRRQISQLHSAAASSGETFWTAREKCWRPDVADVERISWGKPAKKKGTGSRGVPHRLNSEERLLFDQARRKGYLEIGGSGWRSQRRDAPLLNTYRSLCDARSQVSIVLHKGNTGIDELVVDLSPLRLPNTFQDVAKYCLAHADVPGLVEAGAIALHEDDEEKEAKIEGVAEDDDPFETRPIYQLPPYNIAFELPRSEAKSLGKKLAQAFETIEAKAPKSKKPKHVKPGKNRRHGGYGIG